MSLLVYQLNILAFMKKVLFFFILSFFYLQCYSQTVLEKKTIYSEKGVNTDLTNGYGVKNMKGVNFDNDSPNIVEIVDLLDKGFIYRNQNKIVLFNNQLEKIAEKDISILAGAPEGKFKFIPTNSGVWIVQENQSKPKAITVGLLSYTGELKTKVVELPAKYELFEPKKDETRDGLAIYTLLLNKGAYTLKVPNI